MYLFAKKYWLAALLFAFVAPAGLTLLFLKLKKKQVQRCAKMEWLAQLPDYQLTILTFSIHDAQTKLRWEHSREFEWQGQMFDVVNIDTLAANDSLRIRCWHDIEETALNIALHQTMDYLWEHHPASRHSQLQLFDFFKSLFLPPTAAFWQFVAPDFLKKSEFLSFFHHSKAHLPSVFAPPD